MQVINEQVASMVRIFVIDDRPAPCSLPKVHGQRAVKLILQGTAMADKLPPLVPEVWPVNAADCIGILACASSRCSSKCANSAAAACC